MVNNKGIRIIDFKKPKRGATASMSSENPGKWAAKYSAGIDWGRVAKTLGK